MDLVMSSESIHLHVTEVGCAATVLEAVVGCTWEHIVVRSKLQDVLQSLHRGLINEWPAVTRKGHCAVNNVM